MKKLGRIGVVLLLSGALVLAFVGWYSVAANYDYDALAGTYAFSQSGEKCIVYLKSDQTFLQKLVRPGSVQEVHGTWHRYGESHMSFSSEFLRVSGEELNANGQAHGQFEKVFGIFPILTLAPIPNGPTFYKKW